MPLKKALLLGVVYSNDKEASEPSCGQRFRDRVRCKSLEKAGYEVYSLDDKHEASSAVPGRHCQTNFSDSARMMRCLPLSWEWLSQSGFDSIYLDYFFSPAGWRQERWQQGFFQRTLALLGERNIINVGGCIWLPNNDYVNKMITLHEPELIEHFEVVEVESARRCPLFKATDQALDQLMLCPDNMTNETQGKYLDQAFPFICLIRKKPVPKIIIDSAVPPSTPRAKRYSDRPKLSASASTAKKRRLSLSPSFTKGKVAWRELSSLMSANEYNLVTTYNLLKNYDSKIISRKHSRVEDLVPAKVLKAIKKLL